MRKDILLITAVAFALSGAGCAKLKQVTDRACAIEEKEHIRYQTYVASFRSADKVLLEQNNYNMIHAACLAGDPFGVLLSLTRAAATLRL